MGRFFNREFFAFSAALFLFSGFASGASPAPISGDVQFTGNYCGLYAVYAAAIHERVPIDFVSLLKTKYLGCTRGSSLQELQQAAEDHGLHTLPITSMTPLVLRRCDKPVVLYVRSDLSIPTFDHYILYLRFAHGRYVCLDEDRMRSLSEAELMSLWSGAGMVVSADKINLAATLWPAWLGFGSWIVGMIALAVGVKEVSRRLRLRSDWWDSLVRRPSLRHGAIVGTALVAAVAYHRTAAAGLLADGNQVRQVQTAHLGDFIPKLPQPATYAMYLSNRATFIDARFADDFTSGHIEGAVSVPINLDSAARLAAMRSVFLSRPLIVYCQSEGCPFARTVASRLIEDGYADVSIYKEGWVGWHDNKGD